MSPLRGFHRARSLRTCHPERTREGSDPDAQGQILREYAQDDSWGGITHANSGVTDMRLAFMGFRHGHVMPLYRAAVDDARIDVVAACEEHAATAESVAAAGVSITHRNFEQMLRDAAFDALAVGDYFGRRGA